MDEATSEDLAFPSLLGGGTAALSPFQRSPRSAYGSLPPLLGLHKASCDQGDISPWIPPQHFFAMLPVFEGTRRSRAGGLSEKAQDSGFRKHATFAPTSTLEGEQLRFPPSNVRLASLTAPCLPFSGRALTPALRPRGHIPLDPPNIVSPQRCFPSREPDGVGPEDCLSTT
jgi:hypothetical protein